MEVIVKYNGDLEIVADALGAEIEDLGESFAIITLPPELIPALLGFKEIEFVELPKTLSLSLRESMSDACITPVRTGYMGLSGRGVIIGIIDSGIDTNHPDFRDENGSSRILYFRDQAGDEYRGDFPPGFAGDINGHGTSVAGVAAGNGRSSNGKEMGAAPEASLIIVRLGRRGFARTTEIMRSLKYIFDRAMELNMPVAINLSFGTNDGSHAGDSLFETYINAIARRWKSVIVVATGNEGSSGHHFSGHISNGQTTRAVFTVAENLNFVFLTLWSNFADALDLELISPAGQSSGILRGPERARHINLGGTDTSIQIRQPNIFTRSRETFIQLRSPISRGLWTLQITGRDITDGEIHIWLPTTEEVGLTTAFLTPDPLLTLTIPSTVPNVISVGGYNSALTASADFSGRGYTFRDIYIKPDLAAPAVNVLSTRMGGGYGTFSGTSIAAPFVTGAAALMMEWGTITI